MKNNIRSKTIRFNGENTDRLLPDYDFSGHTFFFAFRFNVFSFRIYRIVCIPMLLDLWPYCDNVQFISLTTSNLSFFHFRYVIIHFPCYFCSILLFYFWSLFLSLIHSFCSNANQRRWQKEKQQSQIMIFGQPPSTSLSGRKWKEIRVPMLLFDRVNCGQNSLIASISIFQLNYQSKSQQIESIFLLFQIE